MANRRLTDQQKRRIDHNETKRRKSSLAGHNDDALGTIVARYSKTAIVRDEAGNTHKCHLRPNLAHLVAGDRVFWLHSDTGAAVSAQLERRSELNRPDARGQLKAVAANVNLIAVVIAPAPEPFANLIDRYLVAAHIAGIEAVVILNKADLLAINPESRDLLNRYK